MKQKDASIDAYWQEKSPAFSNQYQTIFGIPFSPVGFFLQARYKKITKILKTLPGKKFLDVGCGSGVFMAQAIEQKRLAIGIDYSPLMIGSAKKTLQGYHKSKYQLFTADATSLPCETNSIDILLACGLTDYLTTKQVALFFCEVKRVLKKGGYAIITFPRKDSPFSFLRNGLGLSLRKTFLRLPPIEQAYNLRGIEELYRKAELVPILWDDVFLTMRIGLSRKK